jgi:hypothetical protein
LKQALDKQTFGSRTDSDNLPRHGGVGFSRDF